MVNFDEYNNYFLSCKKRQLHFNDESDKWVEKVIEMYEYAKPIINEDNYYLINGELDRCTRRTPYKYILDTSVKSKLDKGLSYMYKPLDYFSTTEEKLDFIVQSARNIFYRKYTSNILIPNKEFFDAVDLTGYCHEACFCVKEMCEMHNIKFIIKEIAPGFDESANLMRGYGHHFFVLIELDDKEYLIDIAYKQFFDASYCPLEIMGLYEHSGPWLGIYMVMDDKRKKIAEKLLSNGWIEYTSDNIKDYYDGFALSYRNALYYENLGYIDFSTPYTADDYKKFMDGNDSQLNHEGYDNLGIQRIIIKNPKIEFKTDRKLLKG